MIPGPLCRRNLLLADNRRTYGINFLNVTAVLSLSLSPAVSFSDNRVSFVAHIIRLNTFTPLFLQFSDPARANYIDLTPGGGEPTQVAHYYPVLLLSHFDPAWLSHDMADSKGSRTEWWRTIDCPKSLSSKSRNDVHNFERMHINKPHVSDRRTNTHKLAGICRSFGVLFLSFMSLFEFFYLSCPCASLDRVSK